MPTAGWKEREREAAFAELQRIQDEGRGLFVGLGSPHWRVSYDTHTLTLWPLDFENTVQSRSGKRHYRSTFVGLYKCRWTEEIDGTEVVRGVTEEAKTDDEARQMMAEMLSAAGTFDPAFVEDFRTGDVWKGLNYDNEHNRTLLPWMPWDLLNDEDLAEDETANA